MEAKARRPEITPDEAVLLGCTPLFQGIVMMELVVANDDWVGACVRIHGGTHDSGGCCEPIGENEKVRPTAIIDDG